LGEAEFENDDEVGRQRISVRSARRLLWGHTAAAAPAAVAAPAPAPATPTTAVIPANAAGMNAEALDDELSGLGFRKVIYNADTGKTVLLLSNWTVTGLDNAGIEQSIDKAVVVHVTK
jgi:hypothetical protein